MTDDKKPREFWITSSDEAFVSRSDAEKYMVDWKEELDKTLIHVIEYSAVECLERERKTLVELREHFLKEIARLEAERDLLQKAADLYDVRTAERNNAIKECDELKAERDAARAAIEDRDKMHAEHVQKLNAEVLKLEIENKQAWDKAQALGSQNAEFIVQQKHWPALIIKLRTENDSLKSMCEKLFSHLEEFNEFFPLGMKYEEIKESLSEWQRFKAKGE